MSEVQGEYNIIHTIEQTADIPHGWLHMYQVNTPEEARQLANGREAWLLESTIIKAFYLFIPVKEQA